MVDGLEQEFAGRAHVVRIKLTSVQGEALGEKYGVTLVPTFLVLDPAGKPVAKFEGDAQAAADTVRKLLRESPTLP